MTGEEFLKAEAARFNALSREEQDQELREQGDLASQVLSRTEAVTRFSAWTTAYHPVKPASKPQARTSTRYWERNSDGDDGSSAWMYAAMSGLSSHCSSLDTSCYTSCDCG